MKKFFATICAAAFLITGCGSDKTSAPADKTFTYGTVAYGVAMENVGTNPHESYSGWSTLRYGIGETLFKFNEHMELEPWLAESFEQVDDFTVRIKINDAAKFSNGKKVDGAAVKKCLEALIANHDRAPRDLKISAIEADGQFVTIKSAEKVPALLNYLSDPYGCIIDVDAGIHDGIAVGTGAYKAVKVTDTQIDLVANENYWGTVKPKLDKIFVKSITDGDTLTMAMQKNFSAATATKFLKPKLPASIKRLSTSTRPNFKMSTSAAQFRWRLTRKISAKFCLTATARLQSELFPRI